MTELGGSVLLETSKGDLVIDLYTKDCPKTCENFLKLCKIKYYNGCLFDKVEKDFIAQTGDADGAGGSSVWGLLEGEKKRFFEDELKPQKRKVNRLTHNRYGLVCMANKGRPNTNSSQFFLLLTDRHLDFLDEKHTIFGEVSEGFHVLDALNQVYVDEKHKPMRRFAINHTSVLEDPFPDPPGLADRVPDASPDPRVDSDEEDYVSSASDDEEVDEEVMNALMAAREAKSREVMLEMVGDIADADMAPPKNVLFVCCLNPVTEDEDLELAFSRFGKITSCEILRTRDGKSLQYSFIEFNSVKACEQAYLKMENVRIDDRRIHVDFSQSVPRVWSSWMTGGDLGKGGGKKGGKKGDGKGFKGDGQKGGKKPHGGDERRDDRREDRRQDRGDGREHARDRADDREDKREHRREDRADRREDTRDRRDDREDRREHRREDRGDRREDTRDRRGDREDRREHKRDDRARGDRRSNGQDDSTTAPSRVKEEVDSKKPRNDDAQPTPRLKRVKEEPESIEDRVLRINRERQEDSARAGLTVKEEPGTREPRHRGDALDSSARTRVKEEPESVEDRVLRINRERKENASKADLAVKEEPGTKGESRRRDSFERTRVKREPEPADESRRDRKRRRSADADRDRNRRRGEEGKEGERDDKLRQKDGIRERDDRMSEREKNREGDERDNRRASRREVDRDEGHRQQDRPRHGKEHERERNRDNDRETHRDRRADRGETGAGAERERDRRDRRRDDDKETSKRHREPERERDDPENDSKRREDKTRDTRDRRREEPRVSERERDRDQESRGKEREPEKVAKKEKKDKSGKEKKEKKDKRRRRSSS
ncbi:Peptidyl-prolyl cis-trans isomerase CYP59 [Diplonema papillatum]|nr:Peptidyl-prolyl cis-trans isomerase CYP59 [Diplonema papillatum]WGM50025.1 PPIL4 [Diplonema papillatum]